MTVTFHGWWIPAFITLVSVLWLCWRPRVRDAFDWIYWLFKLVVVAIVDLLAWLTYFMVLYFRTQ